MLGRYQWAVTSCTWLIQHRHKKVKLKDKTNKKEIEKEMIVNNLSFFRIDGLSTTFSK